MLQSSQLANRSASIWKANFSVPCFSGYNMRHCVWHAILIITFCSLRQFCARQNLASKKTRKKIHTPTTFLASVFIGYARRIILNAICIRTAINKTGNELYSHILYDKRQLVGERRSKQAISTPSLRLYKHKIWCWPKPIQDGSSVDHYRFTVVDTSVIPLRGQHILLRSNTRWQEEPQAGE